MLDTVDSGLALVRAEAEDELTLPEGATSLHFMQAIYRDPRQPMTRRMKAAHAALPFEHPKLSATYAVNGDGNFAERMKEIARRSGRSNVIDAHEKHVGNTRHIRDAEGNWVEEPKAIPELPPGEDKMPPFRRRM